MLNIIIKYHLLVRGWELSHTYMRDLLKSTANAALCCASSGIFGQLIHLGRYLHACFSFVRERLKWNVVYMCWLCDCLVQYESGIGKGEAAVGVAFQNAFECLEECFGVVVINIIKIGKYWKMIYLIQQALGNGEDQRSVRCECVHLVEQIAKRDLFGIIAIAPTVDKLKQSKTINLR